MKMLHQLHLAAQYLAMAGKSFLEPRDDDSHTNLGFSVAKKSLFTLPLNDSGILLGLNYNTFSLDWISGGSKQSFKLDGKSHKEAVDWISERARETGMSKPYQFKPHYELPYRMNPSEQFKLENNGEIQELVQIRTLAQTVLNTFLKQENLKSDVCIWPHHFDSGAFVHLHDGSGKSIGIGLAVPDKLVNDFYFYISGFRAKASLNTWAFKRLSNGKWVDNGFKGAVLAASDVGEAMALQFFKEALEVYKNLGS